MLVRVAINGFGRIGRAAFKIALERNSEIEIVAINDLADIENLVYLLKYDSVYGRYARPVKLEEGNLVADGVTVKVLNEKEPTKLPWKELGVDVVIESTGIFLEEDKINDHLEAGAKRVVVSAPTKGGDITTVMVGVNEKNAEGKPIVSNASCTTNCVGLIMAVLENVFGVEKAMMTTAHAYTATQELVDGQAKKSFRRGRAAAINIVPETTGAAVAVVATLPKLKDKFDGVSLRVPVPVVSIADVTALLKKDVTVEEVNQAFSEAVANPIYKGVLAVTDEQTVSSDYIGDPHSAIVALDMTRVVGGNLVKVMAWYDNEWGYSNQLIDMVIHVGK